MELSAFLKLATDKLQANSKSNYDETQLLYITLKKLVDGFDYGIKKEMAYVIYEEYKDKLPDEKWAHYFFDLYRFATPEKMAIQEFKKYHEYLKNESSYEKYILDNGANFRNFINADYLQNHLTEYNDKKEIIDFLLDKYRVYQFDTILKGKIEDNVKKIETLKSDLIKGISPYSYEDYLEIITLFREKIDGEITKNSAYVWIDPKYKDAINKIARDIATSPFPNTSIQEALDILKVDAKEIYNSGSFWFKSFLEKASMSQIHYWDNVTEHDSIKKRQMLLSMSGAVDIKVGANYRIAGTLLNLFELDTEKAYFTCQYFSEQINYTLGIDIKTEQEDAFMVLYDYIQAKKGKTNKINFTAESLKNFTMVYEKIKLEGVLSVDTVNTENEQSNTPKKRNKI